MKRFDLSTDDLLRLQEGHPTKRPRTRLEQEDVLLDEQQGSTSSAHSSNSEDGSDSSENEDELEQDVQSDLVDTTEDRFSSSRVAFVSRASNVAPREAQSSTKPLPSTFASLGISSALLSALSKMSIRSPTEIQAACLPPLLQGKFSNRTGSGKTIAFALPILQRLAVDPYGIFALVLTPTRELAFQISEQFAVLGSALNVRTAVVVGGMDMMTQALELNNRPHVVVATPGRIVDLLKSTAGEWDLSRVKFLVLDEADRLLTPTFAPELSFLFDALPKERQTCLFTATLTPAVESVAQAPPRPGKQKPFIHRMVEAVETVDTLQQHYILVPSHVRESYLYHLLCNPPESILPFRRAPPEPTKGSKKPQAASKSRTKKGKSKSATDDPEAIEQPPPTIIFCKRPRTAAYLTHLLQTLHIRSTALHSRLTQRERLASLGLFRASVVPVLVSTDVGARGLDIADVALVVNWDMPDEPEEYTHRVGRTARRGRGGVAVSFVTERDEERVLRVEARIKTKLSEMALPEAKVLEKLNAVSTAKRLANMELHDSNFGKREEIHKIKSAKRKVDAVSI
ncbi:uncharacterized protein FIBRA_06215 [Fibroporia radiculosa]|uniref:ATP-dependent RNA helicase DBP8 n=1 Tax=Fibroporia radiculosa TaxID=599839 RepID=J4IB52_9APHY|nr:uncharacterized protein FIBRA_06215 [Fibroporia radiculosa]CCM04056.1 predicted protein [Fibroporia radiculosa]